MKLLKTIFPTALLFSCHILSAQLPQLDSMVVWPGGDTIKFDIVRVRSEVELKNFRVAPISYPLVFMPDGVAARMVDVVNAQARINWRQEHKIQLLEQRDTLNEEQIEGLKKIIEVKTLHVAVCEQAQEELNQSIQSLNTQLDKARKTAKDAGKGGFGSKLTGLLLGGGIGLGIGVLLGLIVK